MFDLHSHGNLLEIPWSDQESRPVVPNIFALVLVGFDSQISNICVSYLFLYVLSESIFPQAWRSVPLERVQSHFPTVILVELSPVHTTGLMHESV